MSLSFDDASDEILGEQVRNFQISGEGDVGRETMNGFRTPEVVRKTRDTPTLRCAGRPMHEAKTTSKDFEGKNPLLGQVLNQFSAGGCSKKPPPKSEKQIPSQLYGRPVPVFSFDSPKDHYDIKTKLRGLSEKSSDVCRLEQDFTEIKMIGMGEYGTVYKARHRLDGCLYAIKCSQKPLSFDKECLRELQVHALLRHENVVMYYSSWVEDDHVWIQTEYCPGGSLRDVLKSKAEEEEKRKKEKESRRRTNVDSGSALSAKEALRKRRMKQPHTEVKKPPPPAEASHPVSLTEDVLTGIAKDISRGLAYMHAVNVAHMDVKPDNILVSHDILGAAMAGSSGGALLARGGLSGDGGIGGGQGMRLWQQYRGGGDGRPSSARSFTDSPTSGCGLDVRSSTPVFSFMDGPVVYKIGDFGHATPLTSCYKDDGDDCYLAKEMLDDTASDLTKVDVFALGISLYELATGSKPPKSSEDLWHVLRERGLPPVASLSPFMNSLLQAMTDPLPSNRPSAQSVLVALTEGHLPDTSFKISPVRLELSPETSLDEDAVMESPIKPRVFSSPPISGKNVKRAIIAKK